MSATRFTQVVGALIGLGALAAVAIAGVGTPVPISIDAALLAHVTGLLAGYVVAVMLILMARVPLLEHRIGPDTLARWHASGGRVVLVLILLHAGSAVQAWADSRKQDLLTASLAVLGLPGLVAATISTALIVAIATVSMRAARRRVSYETWHGIHLLTYLAIALSFVHELAGPNLAGRIVLQVGWSLLYAYAVALIVRYRLIAPLLALWRHRLRVQAVIPEADGVVSVIMRGRHIDELAAQPGQFFRWRFITRATYVSAHPFSLSAPPNRDLLRITVKDLGAGSRLVHSVRPGTLVFAEGPSGAMTARRRTRVSVLLIAGGVGITPMRALFETLDIGDGRLTLMYRAPTPADVIFARELQEIARRRGAEVHWMIGPSADPANQFTAENLLRMVPDLAARDVYLCASAGMSAAVRTALRTAGLPHRRLHEENFSF